VKEGYCDPVKIFVKNEPHSSLKIKGKRYRPISSVSLVDQLVERLLYSKQNKLEIANWTEIPSKPGIGFDDNAQTKLWSTMSSQIGEAAETDISAWDWSVQEWELKWEADARYVLSGQGCSGFWRLLRNRAWCEANCVFALSDGRLYTQLIPGKRCSGSYNTSCGNSRMRWAIATLIGCAWAITMGDDCVEQFVPGAREKYEELGHTVKLYKKCDGKSFEFCSSLFIEGVAVPLGWSKTMYRLLSQKMPSRELLMQFRNELRHSPQLPFCIKLLGLLRWGGDNAFQEEPQGKSEGESPCQNSGIQPERQGQVLP
jgi:hypothetical protein